MTISPIQLVNQDCLLRVTVVWSSREDRIAMQTKRSMLSSRGHNEATPVEE